MVKNSTSGGTGQIKTLLLVLPAFMIPSLEFACRSLLGQLEPATTLIIATHESTAAQVNTWLEEYRLTSRCHLIIIDNNTALSMWVQDDLHFIKDKSGAPGLLVSQQAEPHVHSLVKQVADAAGISFTTAKNVPDGGNVLMGDNFILIGGDDWNGFETFFLPEYPKDNIIPITSQLSVPAEQLHSLPAIGEGWQSIFHFGNKTNTAQPVFHIDIFLTLAGRGNDNRPRVLVGDPDMASRLLKQQPLTHALQQHFDDIAAQLVDAGFDVIRNPLPLVFCDHMEKHQRQWYYSSSNNAIVQDCSTAGRIVWLPTYGHGNWPELAATDNANKEIWQSLGFDVRLIAHCQPLAENLGGLRCFSKTWTT